MLRQIHPASHEMLVAPDSDPVLNCLCCECGKKLQSLCCMLCLPCYSELETRDTFPNTRQCTHAQCDPSTAGAPGARPTPRVFANTEPCTDGATCPGEATTAPGACPCSSRTRSSWARPCRAHPRQGQGLVRPQKTRESREAGARVSCTIVCIFRTFLDRLFGSTCERRFPKF